MDTFYRYYYDTFIYLRFLSLLQKRLDLFSGESGLVGAEDNLGANQTDDGGHDQPAKHHLAFLHRSTPPRIFATESALLAPVQQPKIGCGSRTASGFTVSASILCNSRLQALLGCSGGLSQERVRVLQPAVHLTHQ